MHFHLAFSPRVKTALVWPGPYYSVTIIIWRFFFLSRTWNNVFCTVSLFNCTSGILWHCRRRKMLDNSRFSIPLANTRTRFYHYRRLSENLETHCVRHARGGGRDLHIAFLRLQYYNNISATRIGGNLLNI